MFKETHNSTWPHAYEPLLRKIALRFGFSLAETGILINEVYSFINTDWTGPGSSSSFKIRVSKMMVRKCIFKLSAELFSKNDFYAGQPGHHSWPPGYKEQHRLNFKDMPLSFRTVYILQTDAGFTNEEIAEVLNSTSVTIRERLAKARLFINTHSIEPIKP